MAKYIKRIDVMKICQSYSSHCFIANDSSGQDIADRIEDEVVNLPTAEIEEVKHGKIIRNERNIPKMREFHEKGIGLEIGEKSVFWTCSECGSFIRPYNKYCSECGAKMRGDEE